MIQEGMSGNTKKKMSQAGEHLEMSPQVSVQAAQRKKILSPKRQKFENNFEKHMHERYVEKPVTQIPEQMKKLEQPPPFDTALSLYELHGITFDDAERPGDSLQLFAPF